MGHSCLTHAISYASEQLSEESHFNAYHFSIGDTLHQPTVQETLSLGDIRAAMNFRFPDFPSQDGHKYLSCNKKNLSNSLTVLGHQKTALSRSSVLWRGKVRSLSYSHHRTTAVWPEKQNHNSCVALQFSGGLPIR